MGLPARGIWSSSSCSCGSRGGALAGLESVVCARPFFVSKCLLISDVLCLFVYTCLYTHSQTGCRSRSRCRRTRTWTAVCRWGHKQAISFLIECRFLCVLEFDDIELSPIQKHRHINTTPNNARRLARSFCRWPESCEEWPRRGEAKAEHWPEK